MKRGISLLVSVILWHFCLSQDTVSYFSFLQDSISVTTMISETNNKRSFQYELLNIGITPIFIDTTHFKRMTGEKGKSFSLNQKGKDFHEGNNQLVELGRKMKFKKAFEVSSNMVKFYISLGYIDGPLNNALKYFDKKEIGQKKYSVDPEIFDKYAIDIIVYN